MSKDVIREKEILTSLGILYPTYVRYVQGEYYEKALRVLMPYFMRLSRYFVGLDRRKQCGIYESIVVNNISLGGIESYCVFSRYEISILCSAILCGTDISFYCNLGLTHTEFWDTIETCSEQVVDSKLVYDKLIKSHDIQS